MKLSSSLKRHVGVVIFEQRAENVGQLDGHFASEFGFDADQRSDGVEGVEEKVRVDLALQGVEARFEQEALLFFELQLHAQGVPDFDGDADDDGRGEQDECLQPPLRSEQSEQPTGKEVRQPGAAGFGRNDKKEHEELAVNAWAAQIATDPTIKTEVDEGGEGPDLFGCNSTAQEPGEKPQGCVERQRQILAMVQGGKGEDQTTDDGPAGPEKESEENDRLEGDVGGEEVGDSGANPYAERERHEKEGEQSDSLRRAAVFGEEQAAKATGAGQHAGHGGDDAQLYQQRDENEPVGHLHHCIAFEKWSGAYVCCVAAILKGNAEQGPERSSGAEARDDSASCGG